MIQEYDKYLKSFVINLDKYKSNFDKQLPFLNKVGLKPNRFSAINALENEHINYLQYITRYAQLFTPRSTIGCSLSHILLAKEIKDKYLGKPGINYFLILEDDCFPIYSKEQFLKYLFDTINDVELIDKSWDIIQLHSDALFPTYETYQTHFFCGSTAAYLVSRRGIMKLAEEKVTNHIDFITQNFIKYNKYRSRVNLFYTDEKESLNRKHTNYYLAYYKKIILEKLIPLRGEKDWGHFLDFKLLKLPFTNYDITGGEILDFLIFTTLLRKSVKYLK